METKCGSHPEHDAIAGCRSCGKPICHVCAEQQEGLCDDCRKANLHALGQLIKPKKKIRTWVKVLLGCLIAFVALVILLITTCAYLLRNV